MNGDTLQLVTIATSPNHTDIPAALCVWPSTFIG